MAIPAVTSKVNDCVHVDRPLYRKMLRLTQYFDLRKLVSAAAILMAVVSTGVFLHHQDLCVVAVSQDSTSIVRVLLLIGSCSFVDPTTNKPLLITAVQYGHLHTAKGILDSGADVHATDKAGRTALHHAADKDDTALVELLIQAGADVQAPDRDGFTPLMTAAVHGRQAVVERLLASRPDVNALNMFRESALSLSAAKGHGSIVALLLAHNADVNVQDENGQTPFDKAIVGGHDKVAVFLLGLTTLSFADVERHLETAEKKGLPLVTIFLRKRLQEHAWQWEREKQEWRDAENTRHTESYPEPPPHSDSSEGDHKSEKISILSELLGIVVILVFGGIFFFFFLSYY